MGARPAGIIFLAGVISAFVHTVIQQRKLRLTGTVRYRSQGAAARLAIPG